MVFSVTQKIGEFMYKFIISSLAVCLSVAAYAQGGEDEVASDNTVSTSDESGSFNKNCDCSNCGKPKNKK